MTFVFLLAYPLPAGHRLDCHVLHMSEKICYHGASEPNGAGHVDEKVAMALC